MCVLFCCLLQDEVLDMAKKCMANGIQLLVIGKRHHKLQHNTCTANNASGCKLSQRSTVDRMMSCNHVARRHNMFSCLLW
jgi:hypothetical protein